MELRTKLKSSNYSFKIGYNDLIFSIGSCFSVHIADKMNSLGYEVLNNPCGITFNPASLLTTIKRVLNPESLLESQLNFHNGLFSHPDFHGSYNNSDPAVLLRTATNSLTKAQLALKKSKIIFITIGTCQIFRSKRTGYVVNNCHKLPADEFTTELLTQSEIVDSLKELRAEIKEFSQEDVQFIWTVSPVRHIKNGLVQDRISKSIALLATHKLVDQSEDCHYFPSYELMVDDLRDYRFYKDDLIHPSDMAVDYIFKQVEDCLLKDEEADLRTRIKSIKARKGHRPLFPDSDAHQKFNKALEKDMATLVREYPFLEGRL